MKKIFFFIQVLFIFILLQKNYSFAAIKNNIVANIDNQIISSYELKNKIKTLIFLSDQVLNQKNINSTKAQSIRALIEYKLKRKEVERFNISTKNNVNSINYLKNVSAKYKTDLNGLKNIFENNNLDYEIYLDEVKTEFRWQQLIIQMNKDKFNIDDKEIDLELKNINQKKSKVEEFKLAEIEVLLKNNSTDKNLIKEIETQIFNIGFENTAIKFSVSTSAFDGGNLGWINLNSLSNQILDIVKKMEKNDISKPIIQSNSVVFLKLLDKKSSATNELDLNKIRENIVNRKRSELLKLYSNNYLSKIKNNAFIQINE